MSSSPAPTSDSDSDSDSSNSFSGANDDGDGDANNTRSFDCLMSNGVSVSGVGQHNDDGRIVCEGGGRTG